MFIAFAALLAIAQAEEPPPPPEVLQAGQALSDCIGARLDQAEDGVPPETVTDGLLAYCRPQIDATITAHGRWVDSTSLSDAEKAEARAAMQESIASLRAQVIAALQRNRSEN